MSATSAKACGMLETLEKLNSQSSDDVEQIRYLTTRLQALIRDQEKVRKDVVSKTTNGLSILLATLESSKDSQVSINIVQCFLELLHSGKRASLLVSHGATQILLSILCSTFQQQPVNIELMKMLHQVLAKIGPKDRKFGVKARLSGALAITLGIVRTHTGSFSVLLPCLLVLKVYTTNAVNCSYLGKSGAVTCMLKIITICNRKQHHIMKHALDTLGHLVKSKSNSARAIGQGGMVVLLSTYLEWHKGDTRNRHINIRKGILVSLKNITALKSGRKAFIEADGIKILYNAAKEMSEMCVPGKDLEGLTTSISLILRKCFPRNRLPVQTIKSCVPFPLPESPTIPRVDDIQTADDVIDESDDGDDDISTDDETSKEPEEVAELQETSSVCEVFPADLASAPVDELVTSDLHSTPAETSDQRCLCKDCLQLEIEVECSLYTCKRSPQDLQMYANFFKELTEFEEVISEDSNSEHCQEPKEPLDKTQEPIVIPTGVSKNVESPSSVKPNLQSNTKPNKLKGSRLSLPNLAQFQNPSTEEDAIESSKIGSQKSSTTIIGAPKISQNTSPTSDPVNTRFLQKTKQQKFTKSTKGQKSPVKIRKLSRSLPHIKQLSPERQIPRVKSDSCTNCSSDLVSSSMIVSRMNLYSPDKQQQSLDSVQCYTDDINMNISPEMYSKLEEVTKTVLPISKLSFPEIHGHVSPPHSEECNTKQCNIQKSLVFEDIDRLINPEGIIDYAVYDLDAIMNGDGSTLPPKLTSSSVPNGTENGLKFNSLFECGNLRKVTWIRQCEYDLILNSDINSNHHHQWFYFEVSNMKSGLAYRFNIVNCEKPNSQFNFGMQLVMYSVKEAMEGRPSWKRSGTNICYYKNHFSRSSAATGGQKGKSYFTLSFSITFKDDNDICYLAYHYPYSYTMLQAHLWKLESNLGESSDIYYRRENLCQTLGGNICPVLTITSKPSTFDRDGILQFRNKPYIFLTARVHPGESNASWVMKGSLKFLLSSHPISQILRDTFIFKVVPMLNPDGVVNGNHRCSLTGEDLNRRWISPNADLHPTIYHTKGLLQYLASIQRQPLVFCDFHGHSRKKNVFMYGCSTMQSYLPDDLNMYQLGDNIEDTNYKTLPRLLSQIAPSFALSNCSFTVDKGKESTARVVVWREIGVLRSYTMESTYCGCDHGPYKGLQINTAMLEEMGQKFCEGLLKLKRPQISKTSLGTQPVYQYTLTSSEKEDDSLEDTPLSPPPPSATDIAIDGDDLSLDEDGDESDDEEEEEDVAGIPIDDAKHKPQYNQNGYSYK